jgi:hypothetical protein
MTRCPIRRFLVVGLIAAVVGVSVTQADESRPVATGLRVRLTAPSLSGKRLVGTVVGLDETSLTLQREGGKETMQVPRGAITTAETSWRRSRKGKGAVIGALVGLGTAVVLGFAIGENYCGDTPPELRAIMSSLGLVCLSKGETAGVLALVGVPAGALLGLAVAPGEKWHPSSVDRLSIRITPARGGAGLTVSLRF